VSVHLTPDAAGQGARDLPAVGDASRSLEIHPIAHLLPLALAVALAVTGAGTWRCLAAAFSSHRVFAPPESPRSTAPIAANALSPIFSDPVLRWQPQLIIWSRAAGIDPDLAAIVMQIESCGDPMAHSASGAIGLFQVMPFHFAAGEDPYDPATNAHRGLEYLQRALELAGGDPVIALAGYNGGHALIGHDPSSWPAETRRYAAWGAGLLADIQASPPSRTGLQAWLDAGGASLCRQAARHPLAPSSLALADPSMPIP
jgi:soluble lytic murein transglycosylase-like protein